MAISGIISSITNAVTSAIGWFFGMMPLPLRVAFFVFFIIFVVTSVVGFGLGFWYTCDSSGRSYEMSTLQLDTATELAQWGFDNCGDAIDNGTTGWVFFGTFMELGERAYNWAFDVDEKCERFKSQVDVGIVTRDEILHSYAEPVRVEQGFSVGCTREDSDESYVPTVSWYGVNVLDKRIWLLASVLMLLMPFAFQWYDTMFK